MYEAKNYDKCIKYLSDTIDGDVDPYQSKQGAKLELVPEQSCHVATFLLT